MGETRTPLNIRPRILYQVAKAAWEGKLFEKRDELCDLIHHEYEDDVSRHYVANQIRLAMGLDPHDADTILSEYDEEALMGMTSTSVIVADSSACQRCAPGQRSCEQACPFGAIAQDDEGRVIIDGERCLGDGYCVDACSFGALAQKSQFVPLIQLLRQKTHPVYASIAPAFAGQFGDEVTPALLYNALLRLGFTDVIETALYADLITMKEAFEFDDHVKTEHDFLITSCCCPVWIKLIENKFPHLISHISPSVSPMVASARVLKAFEPNAKVVFIGPCVAKKTEATLPDLQGAVDYVLTFQELSTIFEATGIDPKSSELYNQYAQNAASTPEPDILKEDAEKKPASWSGRVYAHTGGVSAAVGATLEKLVPRRSQSFNPIKVEGVLDCQKLLSQIAEGQLTANFIEGMACKGGCVGGPGRLLSPEDGKKQVIRHAFTAAAQTPVENPHVYAILNRLGQQDSIRSTMTGHSPIAHILGRTLREE